MNRTSKCCSMVIIWNSLSMCYENSNSEINVIEIMLSNKVRYGNYNRCEICICVFFVLHSILYLFQCFNPIQNGLFWIFTDRGGGGGGGGRIPAAFG